jgi:hypothetical protein
MKRGAFMPGSVPFVADLLTGRRIFIDADGLACLLHSVAGESGIAKAELTRSRRSVLNFQPPTLHCPFQ